LTHDFTTVIREMIRHENDAPTAAWLLIVQRRVASANLFWVRIAYSAPRPVIAARRPNSQERLRYDKIDCSSAYPTHWRFPEGVTTIIRFVPSAVRRWIFPGTPQATDWSKRDGHDPKVGGGKPPWSKGEALAAAAETFRQSQ
jgi:hypothetical protein